MTMPTPEAHSEFLRAMTERGFMHQCTDFAALDAKAMRESVTAYIGFDCTAPSLHIGNLVGIMLLRHFQNAGHRPIVLMGGGTTKVGDPSGKEESRKKGRKRGKGRKKGKRKKEEREKREGKGKREGKKEGEGRNKERKRGKRRKRERGEEEKKKGKEA